MKANEIISGINLEVIEGALQGKNCFIELDDGKKTVSIGRANDNDFVLRDDRFVERNDKSIGRKHACITVENGMCVIEDLESKNGTWVNGRRIAQKTPIMSGDVFVIGHTYIKITLKIKDVSRKLPDSRAADGLLQLIPQMEQLQNEYGVRVLARLYQFVLDIEQFIIPLTHSLLTGIDESGVLTLPSHSKRLRQLMTQSLEKNNPEAEKDIERYLKDLNYWLIAVIAGYEKAGAQWFDSLWERISPQAIERSLGRKMTSNSPEWTQYKNTVKDINSTLTQDEVKEMAARIAKKIFDDLKKK